MEQYIKIQFIIYCHFILLFFIMSVIYILSHGSVARIKTITPPPPLMTTGNDINNTQAYLFDLDQQQQRIICESGGIINSINLENSTNNNSNNDAAAGVENLLSNVILNTDYFDELYTIRRHSSNFTVVENFFKSQYSLQSIADRKDLVTFVAISDLYLIHHVVPLVERWQSPISITIYIDGPSDFQNALNYINFIRNCGQSAHLVRYFVAIHVILNNNNLPGRLNKNFTGQICKKIRYRFIPNLYENKSDNLGSSSSRQHQYDDNYFNLNYFPIGLAKNVARLAAPTEYILIAPINCYPNANLSTMFTQMIYNDTNNPNKLNVITTTTATTTSSPQPPFASNLNILQQQPLSIKSVYVLPLYELRAFYYPAQKTDLLDMLYLDTAFKNDDGNYNEGYMNWERHPIHNPKLLKTYKTFYNKNQLKKWSPIFISSRLQPLFDESFVERYTIVNFQNSPTFQINIKIMCLLGYKFNVLDNGFLVRKHTQYKMDTATTTTFTGGSNNDDNFSKQRNIEYQKIKHRINIELSFLYGYKTECTI